MSGKVFFAFLSFLFALSFKQYAPGPSGNALLKAYRHADHLYNLPQSTPATDSACMKEFQSLLQSLNQVPGGNDSLEFQSSYKLGVLYEVYKDYSKAKAVYFNALHHALSPDDKFRMNIFIGTSYYNLNDFDSATYFLNRADEFGDQIGSPEDRVRLTNSLGVLYFDNGNYLQAKNYFTQAANLIEKKSPDDKPGLYSLKLNTAICFYKLELYEQALAIYRKLPAEEWLSDPLNMNMGRTLARSHRYPEAMACYQKVSRKKIPGVWNEMARAAMESGKTDLASKWLNAYNNQEKSIHHNKLDDGVNALYRADLNMLLGHPDSALLQLQESLIVFSGNFSDRDIHNNPTVFTGSYAYYWLFEVLMKKAAAWESVYQKTKSPKDLISAGQTWQITISLLSYIERSYAADDAKILLKQKSAEVYEKAMLSCLALNNIFPEAGWLKEAFLIAEKNKASVMTAQLRERNIVASSGIDPEFLSEEKNIRYNLARLNTKAEQGASESEQVKFNEERSAYETQLVALHRKMEKNNIFYRLKYSDDFPKLNAIQKNLGKHRVLISFYNTTDKIELFVLTSTSLRHLELDEGNKIRSDIQSWVRQLQSTDFGKQATTKDLKTTLYQELSKPLIDLAGGQEEWIVVPDGLFFQLPLESLPADSKGRLILEDHALSYEFSARFVVEGKQHAYLNTADNSIMAFAPFTQNGFRTRENEQLEKLPFSGSEIENLKGLQAKDNDAGKNRFLKNLNRYPIVHLATHAVTNLENPSASFIAFYPDSGERTKDFLFLDEIYSLRLDSCQMIVMSACETGRGELVSNEGVLSFARAFLYSGCPSAINTLWKADDRTTAEIFRFFYHYLEEGYSKSKSLQKAKLDFIKNNPVDRNPRFWAHIVLTGDPDPLYKKKQPWIWAALIIFFGTILFWGLRKRGKKKSTLFTGYNWIPKDVV